MIRGEKWGIMAGVDFGIFIRIKAGKRRWCICWKAGFLEIVGMVFFDPVKIVLVF